jgi:two-component system, cell cycle response regulator
MIKSNPGEKNVKSRTPFPKGDAHIPTILVADDSPTALKMTSSVLTKQGYNIIQVSDGEQAVLETFRQKPSAVVVDLKMPKKDGFEVCAEIKRNPSLYIPLLLLTAREDIESLVKGLEVGADDYIIKPFNEMEFVARIKVLLRLKKLNDELMTANRRLKYLSTHDELTELFNHRYVIAMFDKLIRETMENETNLCVALFDIDHFKEVNDNYGHLEGDRVLKVIAQLLTDSFTSDTIIARYGGEEFVGLFPNRSISFVVEACQHVIDDCAKMIFVSEGKEYHLTLSAGVSCTSILNSYRANELIQSADKLLYQSKNNGRNRLTSL